MGNAAPTVRAALRQLVRSIRVSVVGEHQAAVSRSWAIRPGKEDAWQSNRKAALA